MPLKIFLVAGFVLAVLCFVGTLVLSHKNPARTPLMLFGVGIFGLLLLTVGVSRHLHGDDRLLGRSRPHGWYQEVAAGALMIFISVYAYFSSGGTEKDGKEP